MRYCAPNSSAELSQVKMTASNTRSNTPPSRIYGSNLTPVGATTLIAPVWRAKLPPSFWAYRVRQFGEPNSRQFEGLNYRPRGRIRMRQFGWRNSRVYACLLVFPRRTLDAWDRLPPCAASFAGRIIAEFWNSVGYLVMPACLCFSVETLDLGVVAPPLTLVTWVTQVGKLWYP